MKVFKKIGLGIISLGLISTFYIPEAKANLTLFEYTFPDDIPVQGGRTYAIKLVTKMGPNTGKFLIKRVGSGNKDCVKWIYDEATVRSFVSCINKKLDSDLLNGLIETSINSVLDL